jgi:hypothetical protein
MMPIAFYIPSEAQKEYLARKSLQVLIGGSIRRSHYHPTDKKSHTSIIKTAHKTLWLKAPKAVEQAYSAHSARL